jgi:putative hydrolase of the HAD superfamily
MTAIVLLDFGGTLDADGVPWSARFFAAYHKAGGSLSEEEFSSAFRESDRALERLPGIRGLGLRGMIEAQAALLAEMMPASAPDLRLLGRRFYLESVATIERNRPVLEALRNDGYRLGLVANFTGNLRSCLEELDLTTYFGAVADSGVIGCAKPDPRIFHAALNELGGRARESWMVGDNPEADIRPATALGLNTAWLAPARRQTPATLDPTLRITSLTNLPRAIRTHERTHSRRG